ncbi:hypothetical protein KP509_16G066300 [Ceratopteris richardii]|uniref:Uncharacterized protein n=1 Tax=Ceratopteris richardii TaxID=49495 RepID=A0A8T2T3Q6_CERRI|nr:hypothetical protein KP509_16G066300 [Ceratopteris richardii]
MESGLFSMLPWLMMTIAYDDHSYKSRWLDCKYTCICDQSLQDMVGVRKCNGWLKWLKFLGQQFGPSIVSSNLGWSYSTFEGQEQAWLVAYSLIFRKLRLRIDPLLSQLRIMCALENARLLSPSVCMVSLALLWLEHHVQNRLEASKVVVDGSGINMIVSAITHQLKQTSLR